MGKVEFKRGWLARWSKRVFLGALAIAAILWALDTFVAWPIEGYWWVPSSMTTRVENNYLEFKGGGIYFGRWPSPVPYFGTYKRQPGGTYSWILKGVKGPPLTVSVGLFRITASNANVTAHAYRVPACWLRLVRLLSGPG